MDRIEDHSFNRLSGNKTHFLIDLAQGLVGDVASLFRTGTVDRLQVRLILEQTVGLLPDGTAQLHHSLAHSGLEVAVAVTFKLPLDGGA